MEWLRSDPGYLKAAGSARGDPEPMESRATPQKAKARRLDTGFLAARTQLAASYGSLFVTNRVNEFLDDL